MNLPTSASRSAAPDSLHFDFIVIGGGIAGISSAFELAAHGSVCLLEREDQLAYHTTGRSAAISMESYGNALIRALTCASRLFYETAQAAFSESGIQIATPLMSPRGALIVAQPTGADKLTRRFAAVRHMVSSAEKVDASDIMTLAPYLTPEVWTAGIFEPSAFDLDVHGIHSTYLKGLRQRGGKILRNTALASGKHDTRNGSWHLVLQNGQRLSCNSLINAAGAWADDVALRCGIAPVGLRPLQRTVVVVDPQRDLSHTPYLGTIDEDIFIKPDNGCLMISPCDETLRTPCDAQPEEYDIAVTMARLEEATILRPQRLMNSWAGLRSFVTDRSPVVGRDPSAEQFIWLAALGGYGIQAGPALARLCCAAATGAAMPPDLARLGVTFDALSPQRCRNTQFQNQPVQLVADLH